jgi:hypothetical protein
MLDPIDQMFQRANEKIEEERARFDPPGLDPEVYSALFNTELGRLVLTDLTERFCIGPRWVPGESTEAGYFREGQANVVMQIQHFLAEAHREGEPDG